MGNDPVREHAVSKQNPGAKTRRACPICGGELQATVVRYLSKVELDEAGQVSSYVTADSNDPDGYAWDHTATRVYCENDHEVDWLGPESAGWGKTADDAADLLLRPCIAMEPDSGGTTLMTVAEYDDKVTPGYGKQTPLWARTDEAVQVTQLKKGRPDEIGWFAVYVVDPVAYEAQIRRMLGLD